MIIDVLKDGIFSAAYLKWVVIALWVIGKKKPFLLG